MANKSFGPKKPKKGSKKNPVAKNEVTVYAPMQDVTKKSNGRLRTIETNAKGKIYSILNTGKSGDTKLYEAANKPTYMTSKRNKNPSDIYEHNDFIKSMDTTGFSKGKKSFTINSTRRSGGKNGELVKLTKRSGEIPRSKVFSTLNKWKAAASKMTNGVKKSNTKATGKSGG